VRPSRSVCDAADADDADVTFLGATCESALPPTDFEAEPVFALEIVLDAAFADGGEVALFGAGLEAAADCARAAKLPLGTARSFDRAVAL